MKKREKDTFCDFVSDQFEGFRDFEMKRMFGGYGLYLKGRFFSILADGKLYFKTSEKTIDQYLEVGAKPFSFFKRTSSGKRKKVSLKNYYELPLDILESRTRLRAWAEQAAGL